MTVGVARSLRKMFVDGEWVEMGSANYTDRDAYRNNNNAMII